MRFRFVMCMDKMYFQMCLSRARPCINKKGPSWVGYHAERDAAKIGG